MSTKEISNTADILDSRDIIERIEELEAEREPLAEARTSARKAYLAFLDKPHHEQANTNVDRLWREFDAAQMALIDFDETAKGQELKALKALAEQGEDYCSDWKHGETLIRDSYFEDYAEETAFDMGAIDRNATWPLNCIDWEQAARELQMDYSAIDFNGVTYWAR